MSDEILTLDEVASFLKVGKRTVYSSPPPGKYQLSSLVEAGAFGVLSLRHGLPKKWLALNLANRRYLCQHIANSFPPPIFPDGHPNSPTHGHLKLLHLN